MALLENNTPKLSSTTGGSSTASGLSTTALGELQLNPADRTNPGIITAVAQQLTGEKTWNDTSTVPGWHNFAHDGERDGIIFQFRNRADGTTTQRRFYLNKTDTGKNLDLVRYIEGQVTTNPTATLAWSNGRLVPTITNNGAGITGNLIARFDVGGTVTNQVRGYWTVNPSTKQVTELVITQNTLTDGTAVNVTAVHVGNRNATEEIIGSVIKHHNNRQETELFDKLVLAKGVRHTAVRTINFTSTQKEFWLDSWDYNVFIRTNGFDGTVYVPEPNASGFAGGQYIITRITESTGSVTLSLPPASANAFRPLDTSSFNIDVNQSFILQSNNSADWRVFANNKLTDINNLAYSWRQVDLLSTTNVATLSGLVAVSGGTPTAGQRVLLVGQTDKKQNGIYVAAAGAWTRVTDGDANTDYTGGYAVFVSSGVGVNDTYVLKTPVTQVDIGVKDLEFTKVNNVVVQTPITLTLAGELQQKVDTYLLNPTAAATFSLDATKFNYDSVIRVKNISNFDQTLDPTSTQTINGNSTFVLRAGETVEVKKSSDTGFITITNTSSSAGVSAIQTANFTLSNNFAVWLVDAGTPGVTATLPAASAARNSSIVVKKYGGAGNVTVAVQTGENLDGTANGTKVINVNLAAERFYSNGTEWFITA
jgi:hypothetical protein